MIETRDQNGIRLLTMAHGKANVIDIELLAALDEALESARTDSVAAVVLTGSGSIFSAGVDLFRLLDEGRPYLEEFLPALSTGIERLFAFPKPVVAAVNGHAIAGGCVLVCACDLKIGVRGAGRIGVPELRVGVPFPAAVMEVVRFAIGSHRLPGVVLGAGTYPQDEGVTHGFLDRLVDRDADLLDHAVDAAAGLARVGEPTFSFSKRQLRRETLEAINRERSASDDAVLAMWSDADTQEKIRAYLDHTLGSRS